MSPRLLSLMQDWPGESYNVGSKVLCTATFDNLQREPPCPATPRNALLLCMPELSHSHSGAP